MIHSIQSFFVFRRAFYQCMRRVVGLTFKLCYYFICCPCVSFALPFHIWFPNLNRKPDQFFWGFLLLLLSCEKINMELTRDFSRGSSSGCWRLMMSARIFCWGWIVPYITRGMKRRRRRKRMTMNLGNKWRRTNKRQVLMSTTKLGYVFNKDYIDMLCLRKPVACHPSHLGERRT